MKPLIAAAIFGVLMMFASLNVKEKKNLSNFANVLMLILLSINIWELFDIYQLGTNVEYFNSMIVYEPLTVWFNTLIVGLTLFYTLLNAKAIERVGVHVGEYYSLIFFMLVGAHLLAVYENLLILFLAIEIISIPQYVLAGSDKKNVKSSEASLKYFLMGAFSTGITLMGITLLFGGTGTFVISELDFSQFNMLMLSGIILLIVSFGFKVSAAPMHIWTADVYDGAPTPFTGFMATVVKVSIFMAFVKLFLNFFPIKDSWQVLIAIIIVATLLIGNITAVFQHSVKRMLAYSSIAQSGFILFAVFASDAIGFKGLILYAVAYTVATVMLF
ncbi:MAG TPA: NADH-quinone oxidoreductase subunit N, partial [Fermentimonas sp.]|nr:NADH-quinone oxidoreductase subunit N [Fermentimonas sp.]